MKSPIEQSIKEKIKVLARERETTFTELWRNMILERFLTRLALSSYRDKFILKGGTLLAKYLPLGRETQDLDFFIQMLPNTENSLKIVLQTICSIDANDSFAFEVTKIKILDHAHLAYTGAEISLLAKFGATKTIIRMDLGFGDRVEPIDHPIDLTITSKGPLFESKIALHCYPKEFIFAEKLETVVFRGSSNTRMKDFHDLYSLIYLSHLDISLTNRAIQIVFHHRKTSLSTLPITFDQATFGTLDKNWNAYRKKLKIKTGALTPPESIADLVSSLNQWLNRAAIPVFSQSMQLFPQNLKTRDDFSERPFQELPLS